MFKLLSMMSTPLTWGLGKLANLLDKASIWSGKSPGKSGSIVGAISTLGGLAVEFMGFDAANIHAIGGIIETLGKFLQTM